MKNKKTLIILLVSLLIISIGSANAIDVKEKIADCEPKILVFTKMTDIPVNGHYNTAKVLYPFWDGWSLNWFLRNRCYEKIQYCEGNVTVLNDLGKCRYDSEIYSDSLKDPEISGWLAKLPEMRCKVSSCVNSGWKDKLYTYTYKKVIGSERKCWKIFSSKICWNAPVTEEVTEKHTLPDWTRKAREHFNNENITEEEVLKELTK